MRAAVVATVLALALAACSDAGAPSAAAPAPRDRPLAQDGTTARAITSMPDRVKVKLDLATVRTGLQAWRGEHGTWPASLAELRIEGLSYPADLDYDPAAGTVQSRTYPGE
jgi:hypothetical protein